MHLTTRRLSASAVLALALSLVSRPAGAQAASPAVGPQAGTWGTEVILGGGSGAALLHFSSPDAAWVVGGSLNAAQRSEDNLYYDYLGNPTVTQRSFTTVFAQLSAGRRWYGGTVREQLRPVVGVGAIGMIGGGDDDHYWGAGGYGELGAAYFFTPHLSVGATTQVIAMRTDERYRSGDFVLQRRAWSLNAQLVRVGGAVYF